MKKLNLYFLLMVMSLSLFTACKDDDDPINLGAPEISAKKPGVQQMAGKEAVIQLDIEAEAGIKSLAVSGDASGNVAFEAEKNEQTVTYNFAVPADAAEGATYDLTFTLTDKENETATATVTVTATAEPVEGSEITVHLQENMNVVADPGLVPGSRTADMSLNPVPTGDAVTSNLAEYPSGDFFNKVNYKGAFDPSGDTWLTGWSTLSKYGYLTNSPATVEYAYDPATATIIDVPQVVSGDVTWTSNNVYRLDGYTFVTSGTLTIEPGTVIIGKADPTTDDASTALIITRDAMIMAEGTAENPIIFTSELDNAQGALTEDDAGQWAGLIVLGKAPVYSAGATEIQIEGIPDGEGRAMHGGDDEEHNSGVLKYISIRYSGSAIGSGDEIQGLTLGSVGRGTTIDYIEIFSSLDDGIEFFGGTVNVKHAAVAFADDDSFDWDLGWSGNGQFWFAIQKDRESADFGGDYAGEWDGADPDDAPLYANPTIYNATFIGRGMESTSRGTEKTAILMRDGTAGTLANSIITDFNGKGIEVEDTDKPVDSYGRIGVELFIMNNIWNVGGGTEVDDSENGIVQLTGMQ